MAGDFKKVGRVTHYSEDVELQLRKIGKDYCEKCGESFNGSEVSPERLKRWVEGREEAIYPTCRDKSLLTKRFVIFVIFLPSAVIALLILSR